MPLWCEQLLLRHAPLDIRRDELVTPATWQTRRNYAGTLRLVTAQVEIDGRTEVMTFLTNHATWAASSVAEFYTHPYDRIVAPGIADFDAAIKSAPTDLRRALTLVDHAWQQHTAALFPHAA